MLIISIVKEKFVVYPLFLKFAKRTQSLRLARYSSEHYPSFDNRKDAKLYLEVTMNK
jgi:hypothetical protein